MNNTKEAAPKSADAIRTRRLTLAGIAVALIAAVSLFALACCPRRTVDIGPAHRLPSPEQITLPVPSAVTAASDTVTDAVMRNVMFHIDDDAILGVRELRGRVTDLRGQHIVLLDDKTKIEIAMSAAELTLTPRDLTLVLNRYVFGYKGSPLKDLAVRVEGNHIVQTGTMHKIIDIPFEITATLAVSPEGWIQIHPTKIKICSLDGAALLKAVGSDLESLLDLKGAKGARVKKNDLFIDPLASLPPPRITGRLTRIYVQDGVIVQTFVQSGSPAGGAGSGSGSVDASLEPPVAAPNFIYFRGGSVQLGKLFMVKTDLEVIDGDISDPFEFYLDYYNTQLVAGYHVSTRDFGLVAYMPDFGDIGTAKAKLR